MAEKTLNNIRLSLWCKTAAEWASFKTVPVKGEPLVEFSTVSEGDTTRAVTNLKIGDGVHTFAELPYVSPDVAIFVTQTLLAEELAKYTKTEGLHTLFTQYVAEDNVVVDANYVHTDNNYDAAAVEKLAGIEAGAEVNVQADWNVTDATSDAFIKNKPTKMSDFTNDNNFVSDANYVHTDNNYDAAAVEKLAGITAGANVVDANYVHTDNNYTTDEKEKLAGVEAGAEVNVQADWTITDTASDAFIKNKPTKLTDFTNDGDFVTDAEYVHTDNNYDDAAVEKLAGIAAGAEVNVQADWNETQTASDAFILNKPTKVSDFENDSDFATNDEVDKKIAALGTLFVIKGRVDTFEALPTEGNQTGDLWFVGTADTENVDEYVYRTDGRWELIGSAKAETALENYYTKDEADEKFVHSDDDTVVYTTDTLILNCGL